jgi:conjugative transfer region protein TrbK
MSGRGGLKRVMRVTTAAAVPILVAACTIQLRGDSDGPLTISSASRATSPLGGELERCRKVTSEQVAELRKCRLMLGGEPPPLPWLKENTGRCFRRCSTRQPDTVVGAAKASQSSPQGWPPVAAPERE